MEQRSLEYQLRGAQQRRIGVQTELHDTFTFRLIADRFDCDNDIERIERAMRQEQRALRNLQQETL